MKISFLVPAFNVERTLCDAVESILRQGTEHQKEIIVIDDGSGDGTPGVAQKLSERYSEVCVLSCSNGGEAHALNVGLARATGNFVAIVEADVELTNGWLEKVLSHFDDEKVIGVGGMLLTPRAEPWIARIAGYEVELKFATKEKYTCHITSANAMYRAEAFTIAGPFDERLVNASLDSDFNCKLISRGYKLVFVREAEAFHHYKRSLAGYLSRNFSYARYRLNVKSAFLYPADRLLAVNIFLCAMFLLSVCTAPISKAYLLSIVLFGVLLILQAPDTVKLYKFKRDPILFVYPFVSIIRNMVAVAGLGIGFFRKLSPR